MISLLSTETRVESPFIIAKIGNYTFGHCAINSNKEKLRTIMKVVFPNYVQSLNITKINGTVNIYSLKLTYAITETDDPNLLEKVFSSVSQSRKIILSYGDWNAPGFIYKEEEGIITKINTQVDLLSSSITYTLSCTSTALALRSGNFSFPKRTAKPSDVIIELLRNKAYGLTDIFSGMIDITKVLNNNLIARNDKSVSIDSKTNINILDYIGYLVSCMGSLNDPPKGLKSSRYYWSVYDDINNEFGGTYFKVVQVDAESKYNLDYNTYEIDVGYPSSNLVSQFSINNDDSWSLLYNYSKQLNLPQYSYTIDNNGKIISNDSPTILNSSKDLIAHTADITWWSEMTNFPITAKLTIKGLLRPALLMSYVKINCYFYGHKHISSGLYIITKQEDEINSNGYKTNLSLTRISGDENGV